MLVSWLTGDALGGAQEEERTDAHKLHAAFPATFLWQSLSPSNQRAGSTNILLDAKSNGSHGVTCAAPAGVCVCGSFRSMCVSCAKLTGLHKLVVYEMATAISLLPALECGARATFPALAR